MEKIEETKIYHFFEEKMDPIKKISAIALMTRAVEEAETANSIDIKIEIKKFI